MLPVLRIRDAHRPAKDLRCLTLISVALISIASAANVAAQEAPSPAEKGDDVVQALDAAMATVAEGDLDGAIEAVERLRADGNQRSPLIGGVLGGLYVEAGRVEEGLALLSPIADREDANPAVLYNAGRAAAALGRLQIAGRYLERAIALEPGSPATRELGMLLIGFDRQQQGYPYLRHWALANPQDAEANRMAALAAVQLERVPDAEEFLARLSQEDPRVKLLWSQVLLQKGDPYGALGFLEPMKEVVPEPMEKDFRRTMAKAYVAVGDAASAASLLEAALEDSADPSVSLQLSDAYMQLGRPEEAASILEPYAAPLIEAELPEDPPPLGLEMILEYGRALQVAGRTEEALPFLELAVELMPNRKQAWNSFGQILAATGDRERAQQAMKRFQELNEGEDDEVTSVNQMKADVADPTGRVIREAMQLSAEGDLEQALSELAKESVMSPEDPRPALLASRLLMRAGRLDEALAAAQRAAALAPDRADSHYQLGASLMALERFDESEKAYQRALEIQADHTPTLNDYAVLLIHLGRVEEARGLLERVLLVRPEDSLARQNLESLDRSQ